jgi:hypothetical protein
VKEALLPLYRSGDLTKDKFKEAARKITHDMSTLTKEEVDAALIDAVEQLEHSLHV